MCGNVGMLSLSAKVLGYNKRRDWLASALFVDTLRGEHSTGLGLVHFSDMSKPVVMKRAVPGYDFVELKEVQSALSCTDLYTVMMGHNRKATTGAINEKNAHPFIHEHILMAHNGTVNKNLSGLDSKFEVDSEGLCHALSTKPPIEVLEGIFGAYALQWYDSEKHCYYIARNKERPLHFAFHEQGLYMLIASESWMIRGLAAKHELELDDDQVFSLNPGYLLEFNMDTLTDLREYKATKFNTEAVKNTSPFPGTRKMSAGKRVGRELFKKKQSLVRGSDQWNKHKSNLDIIGLGFDQRVRISQLEFTPYKDGAILTEKTRGCVEGMVGLRNCSRGTMVETISHNVEFREALDEPRGSVWGTVIGCTVRVEDNNPNKRFFLLLVNNLTKDKKGNMPLVDEQGFIPGPGGVYISTKEYKQLTHNGCAICSASISTSEAKDLDWMDNEQPICPLCVADMDDAANHDINVASRYLN